MNGTEGCRGHGEKGGSVKYKNNLLHMGQKLWDDLFKTGCHPPPPFYLLHLPLGKEGETGDCSGGGDYI